MASSNPFFQGNLHEAIAHSMQSSLHFAALIVDDGGDATPDSRVWEEEYLGDEELAKILKQRTILYRIAAESQEAMNLYAFLPRPEKLPCLVVIKSGTAQVESIGSADGEKTLEEVREWVGRVVGPVDVEGMMVGSTAPASTTSPTPVVQDIEPLAQSPQPTIAPTITPTDTPTITTPPAVSSLSSNVYDPPTSDTSTTLTAEKKGKGKATSDESLSSSSTKTAQDRERARREAHLAQQASRNSNLGYLAEQRRRAQEAGVERERVKKLLEADKAMRVAREKEAREAREQERGGGKSGSGGGAQEIGRRATSVDSKECALSFRLLDGSALKHKFPAEVKLGVEVRKWIDLNRPDETDRPYTFTQLLTPFPNKQLSLSEENTSLKGLGLTPSATLVLTPSNTIQASAYPSLSAIPSPWRLVSALTTSVSSVVDMGYNAVTSAIGAVTGGQPAQPATTDTTNSVLQVQQGGSNSPRPSRGNGETRIRTIHDGSRGLTEGRNTGNRFYNGNQLNFEPNQDGKDGKDGR
ncbi:hypothetical protein BGX38DRAFT_1274583 [Terfezia claveryi]|nr:hypothetical protein BGX38DRAFT_1274583 [Terfezia claveryi]